MTMMLAMLIMVGYALAVPVFQDDPTRRRQQNRNPQQVGATQQGGGLQQGRNPQGPQTSYFQLYDAVWLKDPHLIDDVTTVLKYCLLVALFREKGLISRILETYERDNGKQEALESVYKKLNIKRSTCS